jgi:superfamily II DNA or RNA helicase
MVLPTGGGKTRILSAIVEAHRGASCVIAHRSEIVAQLSLALAECGVRHNLIASKRDKDAIAALHIKALGKCFFDPGAPCAVASVDTLIRRKDLDAWAAQVTLWVTDEGHHLVLDNKWDKAIKRFTNPNVRGLQPSATILRADGQGLGRPELGGNGVADALTIGPEPRWLIDEGYLCDYRVIGANSHVEELLGEVGASGDWSTAQLRAATERTPIVGDAAATYAALNAGTIRGVPPAPNGRTGILFAPDVDMAGDFLRELRARGVRAELVTGETDPTVRRNTFAALEARTLELVVAVDIVSEGTDIPALELGIFCRATMSLAVYMQQFGRVLRPLMTPQYKAARTREERLAAIAASPKPLAYIIDHVGNFTRHGPPDRPRQWSLVSTARKRGPSDAVATRYCCEPTCLQAFERFRPCCPYCGWEPPPPAGRSSPDQVAGDMVMLDPEVLAALRGQADAAVMSLDDYRAKLAASGLPQQYIWKNAKSHAVKVQAQEALRVVMADWGGYAKAAGLSDREIQRLFFERFGVDVLTPLSYGPTEAGQLIERILFDGAVKSL